MPRAQQAERVRPADLQLDSATRAPATDRFAALDAWRGLAALARRSLRGSALMMALGPGMRGALAAGAPREQLLFVLKCAAVMSIHSCSLGAPILLEEAKAAGRSAAPAPAVATPAVDAMKRIGQWNVAWDPFFALDPAWTDEFMATGAGIYGSGVVSAKDTELISIAFDASFTHMYAPGTRRHIHNALQAGATIEEIFEVLKLCVAQGAQACNLALPILAEELTRQADGAAQGAS